MTDKDLANLLLADPERASRAILLAFKMQNACLCFDWPKQTPSFTTQEKNLLEHEDDLSYLLAHSSNQIDLSYLLA